MFFYLAKQERGPMRPQARAVVSQEDLAARAADLAVPRLEAGDHATAPASYR